MPGLFFRGKPGDLGVRNANMGDFTGLMQEAVLDRPVLEQTGLTGRFDFTLLWTPDDSQFQGMGAKIPPPTDTANAPPNLYTALRSRSALSWKLPRRRLTSWSLTMPRNLPITDAA